LVFAQVGDTGFMAIAAHCRALKYLNATSLPDLSDIGLRYLARGSRVYVNVAGCPRITPRGLWQLAPDRAGSPLL
jgi:hypothetical protein